MNVTFTKGNVTVVISFDNGVVFDIARDIASDESIDLDEFRNTSIQL